MKRITLGAACKLITFKPYTEELIASVKAFNTRLDAGSAPPEFRFPECHIPESLPKVDGRRLFEEYFLLLEDGAVRGGYRLKHQDFSFHGEVRSIALFHWQISEGLVDRKYAWVFLHMLNSALKAQPLLYGLAMGPQIQRALTSLGWSMGTVAFHFKVNSPDRFLRQIRAMRKTPAQRLLMDIAARTGTGGLLLRILQSARAKRGESEERTEVVQGFSGWADDLWHKCEGQYAMIAVRDSETLNILYPGTSKRFVRCKITRGGAVLGWAVLLDTPMHDNKYFGNLRVGSIVDCLALPENADAVVRAATRVLEERGVDLIVSNQSHSSWSAAFRSAGFLAGPSNFLFATSKELSKPLHPFQIKMAQAHLTRGDGDGPIHL
ncbi:MAG: hypothetical protein DMG49_02575 [Acidobacteria bacterium]|nr:MAG: hypothetical protein DMG49_02575 [Acidobacteriota bacterium]